MSGAVQLALSFPPSFNTIDWTVDGVAIGSGVTVAWDTTSVANGSHLVRARLNAVANSYVVDVTRTFQVSQTTVRFNGATASESLGAFTAITGAQSVNGIIHVDATLDGVVLGTLTAPNACLDSTGVACATTGPNGYQFTGTVVGGSHVIVFKATDGAANSLSTQVPLTVTDVP